MRYEAQPVKATMAIVTEDGTVFEVEGLMEVSYSTAQDAFFDWPADLPYPAVLRPAPILHVHAVIRGFEGSITVPPEMVR